MAEFLPSTMYIYFFYLSLFLNLIIISTTITRIISVSSSVLPFPWPICHSLSHFYAEFTRQRSTIIKIYQCRMILIVKAMSLYWAPTQVLGVLCSVSFSSQLTLPNGFFLTQKFGEWFHFMVDQVVATINYSNNLTDFLRLPTYFYALSLLISYSHTDISEIVYM